jgi:dTDP-4-dehydrorhamnose 3,5-epimerase
MLFKETALKGAYVINLETKEDGRGFFARSFCQQEFKKIGIDFNIVQSNISYNKTKGTLRGMHYQAVPHEEAKIVACVKGAIYDVIIDLRVGSSTYCKRFAIELSDKNYISLYIPKGFAHGFQTLEDDAVVFYQMSEFYYPESARGVRWNDGSFDVDWPISSRLLSDKDASYPDYKKTKITGGSN